MAKQQLYEILYIIDPTLTEAEIDEVHNKVKEEVTSKEGTIRREDKWGKRHLAYEVNKFREGFYAYIEFNGTGTTVNELKSMFRLEGRVIRYLITAVPKAKLEEEKRKAREAARRAELAKKKAEEELRAAEAAAQQAEAMEEKKQAAAEAAQAEQPAPAVEVKKEEVTEDTAKE